MTQSQASQPHEPGQTSGSPERAAQQLTGTELAFNLAEEAAQVRLERGYREGDRNANTLVKADTFRIVVTALRAGARLEEHRAAGWVAIQTLTGHVQLRIGGDTIALPAGHLLALAPDVSHDVEALEESVLLLTLAWPSGGGDA
ncbi:MAG TPA: cupin domain-containing protein [Chloroflexota bacterium]|jgi:quercetin dioxygenase-like cupin family protein